MGTQEPTHTPSRTLLRLQAASGVVLSIFVALHLLNLFSACLGPQIYNHMQRWFRLLYQFPPFEALGLGLALLVHLTCGLLRWRERSRRAKAQPETRRPPPWGLRLHRWSAYYLALVVFGHAAATRLPSLLLGVWPEFAGVGFSLWWMPGFFYPYYFLFALCGTYHLLYGWTMAIRALKIGWLPGLRPGQVRAMSAVAAVLIALALLSFGGLLGDVPSPTDNDYARVYQRLLGVKLPAAPATPRI